MIRFAVVVGQETPEETHSPGGLIENAPLFRFGVISDIQYADFDDRLSSTGKRRYYRAALPSVERAVAQWNREQVNFAIHCGDIVDGVNRTNKQSDRALDSVLQKLAPCKMEFKHVLGNHCTCQFNRSALLKKLKFQTDLGYYAFSPMPGWKFLVLDTCDVSIYAWPSDHPNTKLAYQILKEKNPNKNWSNPSLLEGLDRRFMSYNGAVGEVQLTWLRNELKSAQKLHQKVFIFTHIPLIPHPVLPGGLLWNFDVVTSIIQSYPSVVQAVISGHVHDWSHFKDSFGIHYFTLPGVVEQAPGEEGHGIVNVYEDRLSIAGFGKHKPPVFLFH